MDIPTFGKPNYSKRSERTFTQESKGNLSDTSSNKQDGIEELFIHLMLGKIPTNFSKKKSKQNRDVCGTEIIQFLKNNSSENIQKNEKEDKCSFASRRWGVIAIPNRC